MRLVILSSRAERDLAAASLLYEHERTGLGAEFLTVIDATFALLARSPGVFRERRGMVRMALTPRFPFLVCYIWNEAEDFVAVLRVLHTKRDIAGELSSKPKKTKS